MVRNSGSRASAFRGSVGLIGKESRQRRRLILFLTVLLVLSLVILMKASSRHGRRYQGVEPRSRGRRDAVPPAAEQANQLEPGAKTTTRSTGGGGMLPQPSPQQQTDFTPDGGGPGAADTAKDHSPHRNDAANNEHGNANRGGEEDKEREKDDVDPRHDNGAVEEENDDKDEEEKEDNPGQEEEEEGDNHNRNNDHRDVDDGVGGDVEGDGKDPEQGPTPPIGFEVDTVKGDVNDENAGMVWGPQMAPRGPLDHDGRPLTNGAGVEYHYPFNGKCTTRDAALLAPRSPEYDPHGHAVIIGIISIDNENHYGLRMAQRDTWLTYKNVATVKNGFRGLVLVEYVVGLAYENDFRFSQDLLTEAAFHQDIVGVQLHEMKRKEKSLLTTGKYGKVPEVIMTFKTLSFYCYAENAYPYTKYVIKADDDQFMRIPVLLRTVMSLPAAGVIWGTMNRPKPSKKQPRRFCGTSGMLVGLSRDVLSLVNHYEPVQKFARVDPGKPYVVGIGKISLVWIYTYTGLFAEDVIAAYVLDSTRMLPQTNYVFFYNEMACRLHNHNADTRGRYAYFVNPFSMVIHHANRTEQFHYMKLFPETRVYDTTFPITKRTHPSRCYGRKIRQTPICTHPDAMIHL